MAKVILGTTISLDGFINDRNGSVSALYLDLAALQDTEPMRESIQKTGAALPASQGNVSRLVWRMSCTLISCRCCSAAV